MLASRSGDPAVVKLLLEHGANVNAAEQANGQTALMWPVSQRQPDVVARETPAWIQCRHPTAGAAPRDDGAGESQRGDAAGSSALFPPFLLH